MANGIRTGNPRGFNKGHSSKFREGSQIRQTPEEGRRTYRPKCCGNNNKDEDKKRILYYIQLFFFKSAIKKNDCNGTLTNKRL